MQITKLDLSIIIINWNSAEYLKKCLTSILSQTNSVDFEIIVVDNASFDGSYEMIKQNFPGVIFIQNKENIGFAKANNLGYQYSTGKTLLFLNPDTEVIGSSILTMLDYLLSLPGAGAVGCKLLNSDLSIQTDCVQPFPSILQQVFDAEFLITGFPNFIIWRSNPFRSNQGKPVVVDVIIGACVMISRDVFQKIDLFSTDYFMYAEDIDLCYKIKQFGYKTYYVSSASIIHHGGGSTKNKTHNDFKLFTMNDSVLKFIKKTKGNYYAAFFRLTVTVVASYRLFLIALLIPVQKIIPFRYPLLQAFHKWRKILLWSINSCIK